MNDKVKSGDTRVEETSRAPGPEAVLIPERPAPVHRGMRGWGETQQPEEFPMDVEQEPDSRLQAVSSEGDAPEEKQTIAEPKPSLELRIFGVAGRSVQKEPASIPSTGISYDSDWEDRALDSAIWTGESIEAPHRTKDGTNDITMSRERPNDLARIANRERLLARLEKEKKQTATIEQSPPEPNTANTLAAHHPTSSDTKAADSETAEAEAKAKARLRLKLRLEREKAAAQAKQEDTGDTTDPTDRAAALRAKLLEKKMAASRVH